MQSDDTMLPSTSVTHDGLWTKLSLKFIINQKFCVYHELVLVKRNLEK